MRIKLNDTQLTLADIRAALPGRRWVTAAEVKKAMGLTGSVGHLLGVMGLVRTVVRVGNSAVRVWLIQDSPAGDTPQTVRVELLTYGVTTTTKPRVKVKRSTFVKLGPSKQIPASQSPNSPGIEYSE